MEEMYYDECRELYREQYRIEKSIPHGKDIRVFLAVDEKSGKRVVLKEYLAEILTPDFYNSIKSGIELLTRIDHPSVPHPELIMEADSLLLKMKYNVGRDLRMITNRSGALDPCLVREWAIQVCDALQCMHALNPPVLYLALTPSNLFLTSEYQIIFVETVQMMEKGKDTGVHFIGYRGYVAPEQFGGNMGLDERTDIYGFGTTFYHLLTGKSPAETGYVILPLRQLNPSLAGSRWEKIIAKCCQPDPRKRYKNCDELMKDLKKLPTAK